MGDNTLTISVFNSEQQRSFEMFVRKDRLAAFYEFLNSNRCPDAKSGMPGLSWSAHCGLDAIFEKRPRKFPVADILTFFADHYIPRSPCDRVTPAEIEKALEGFAVLYPPDVVESA